MSYNLQFCDKGVGVGAFLNPEIYYKIYFKKLKEMKLKVKSFESMKTFSTLESWWNCG